jgi:hypothetical protein
MHGQRLAKEVHVREKRQYDERRTRQRLLDPPASHVERDDRGGDQRQGMKQVEQAHGVARAIRGEVERGAIGLTLAELPRAPRGAEDPLVALDIDGVRQQHQEDEHAQRHEPRLHDACGARGKRHGDECGEPKVEAVLLPEQIRDPNEQRHHEEPETCRLTDPSPDRQRTEERTTGHAGNWPAAETR